MIRFTFRKYIRSQPVRMYVYVVVLVGSLVFFTIALGLGETVNSQTNLTSRWTHTYNTLLSLLIKALKHWDRITLLSTFLIGACHKIKKKEMYHYHEKVRSSCISLSTRWMVD